jgi:lipoprotein-anchoring transpeptidase ErfK/SrfK
MYLYEGNKDTMYRIHGTNHPEYIGHAISSGCIRLTNEDVIDLYNRAKIGTTVTVLKSTGDPRSNPRMVLSGASNRK